jgi:Mg2+-importing ATPase
VTWVLIRFMLLMAPVVFLINGFSKGDWREAFFFTLAVAVGLTPELLPLIVTTNLVKGALQMARAQVIVKHLPAIQNLGAIDVLCTDKTGTLTENQVTLVRHLDAGGCASTRVLHLAYLNSAYQTGLKNLLDQAILDQAEQHHPAWRTVRPPYHKLDELPFDFVRQRMSVIVQQESEPPQLICKGALEEIVPICWGVEQQGEVVPLTEVVQARIERQGKLLQDEGLRVIAVASKRLSYLHTQYTLEDEQDLVFAGFLGFLDPAKASAKATLEALSQQGVAVKVLTGDHEGITTWICEEVGLNPSRMVLAHEIDGMDDEELAKIAEQTVVFARVNPLHKVRILQALKRNGHTVGYLGDGINDAAALREADVGISVDTAVDIAKASADLILLHKDLQVLAQGILEGRRVFGNIVKYVKMAASSNFGNALSVLLASAFLPFLPMLSLQLLVQNLFYDLSQLALPWDHLDREFLSQPRQWDARGLIRFMLCFGPLSSLFDLTTFAVLWFVFRANVPAAQSLFQSGWFVEGLLSQTLIVHLLRTQKIPFLQSRASLPVLFLTGSLMLVGLILPFTPAGSAIGLQALPWSYFPWLLMTLLAYCVLTQFVKTRYLRWVRSWL